MKLLLEELIEEGLPQRRLYENGMFPYATEIKSTLCICHEILVYAGMYTFQLRNNEILMSKGRRIITASNSESYTDTDVDDSGDGSINKVF